jgi:hypothetical protein
MRVEGVGQGLQSGLLEPAASAAASASRRCCRRHRCVGPQVLDGVAVTAAEQAAARNRYAGRLTLHFLEERLGHRLFDRIRDLDCSGLRIRDVGAVFLSEELEGLQVRAAARRGAGGVGWLRWRWRGGGSSEVKAKS